MPVEIRPARAADGEALRQIERSAGERFREVDMAEVADDEPPSVEVLAGYAAAGRSWVAVDGDDPVGYVLVDLVDGCAHIEQVSVAAGRQGGGIGRTLIEHVATWATDAGLPALTLTTFADVAWNAPLYERWGFRVLRGAEVGPELRAVCDAEAAHGLDPALRVCMRRDLAR